MRVLWIAVLIAITINFHSAARGSDSSREYPKQQRITELLDDYLERAYKELLRSANTEHAAEIREAQRTWLKYRDAEIKAVAKRTQDPNPIWQQTREDDRRFRLNQLTLTRIEGLAHQLPYRPQNYANEMYVGSYSAMVDDLSIELEVGSRELDVFKVEAHRGIDGKSGTHFSIFGFARITAPRVLTINGNGGEAAKALILGEECILYWEDYAFFLLARH